MKVKHVLLTAPKPGHLSQKLALYIIDRATAENSADITFIQVLTSLIYITRSHSYQNPYLSFQN
jgi:hypothetical protein